MNFRALPPANRGKATTETDPVAGLFSADYVFGAQTFAIEDTPGPSAPIGTAPASTEEPPDVTSQPAEITAHKPASHKTNSAWYKWPSGQTTLVVKLPNGAAVRSVWFPVVPFPIVLSPGQAPGSVMYQITTVGGELVPIPDGTESLSLTFVSPPAAWKAIWVFVSGETYPPQKAAQQDGLGVSLAYDDMIISTPTLLNYWPLNDPTGTQLCSDLGPTPNPMKALGDTSLGATGFLSDDATCAYSPANAGDGFAPLSPVTTSRQAFSIEFWVAAASRSATILGGNGGALGMQINDYNQLTIDDGYVNTNTQIVVSPLAPTYFALTINNSVLDVYMNASLVRATTFINNTAYLAWMFDGLGNGGGGGGQLAGKLAKVALYSGVLSLSQLRAHFAAGT